MKYIQRKTVLLGSVLGVAVGLFAGALVLGERLSPPVSGLCFGVAGILGVKKSYLEEKITFKKS